MDWVLGLLFGGAAAVLDVRLMRLITRRAARDMKTVSATLIKGFAARYLITLAVIAFALFMPGINAIAVLLAMIAEKIFLVIDAARRK